MIVKKRLHGFKPKLYSMCLLPYNTDDKQFNKMYVMFV